MKKYNVHILNELNYDSVFIGEFESHTDAFSEAIDYMENNYEVDMQNAFMAFDMSNENITISIGSTTYKIIINTGDK
mgnify:CR=1 FL=1